MNNMNNIHGFLPGGEDRVQWIFEGEWTDNMMEPLLTVVHKHIRFIRERYGWDVNNYFEFSYSGEGDLRRYFATRCNWRWFLAAETVEELAEKLQEEIKR